MARQKFKLTEEEKARWAPFLHDTFSAIAPDVLPILDEQFGKRGRRSGIIEMTLDANRMQMYSDITREEEKVLTTLWVDNDRNTMRWLREELNY